MRELGPVIGRDGEIRDVTETLLSTGASARTLLIVGGPGTGKTAVVEQARRAATEDGAKVLRLRCHDGASPPGAAALADGVHSVLAKFHDRRSPVRVGAVRRIRLQSSGQDGELALLSVLSEILADAAAHIPFAVVVDDVEQMPQPTASALGLLLRVFRPAGVPMVMAGRPVRPGDDGASPLTAAADRLLELPPLRPSDVEALVVRRLGRPVEPALVTAVLGALGPMAGTPEAVLSVLDAMEEHGDFLELDGHVCLTEPERTLRLSDGMTDLSRFRRPGSPPDTISLEATAAVARIVEHAEVRLDDLLRLKPGGPRRAGLVDRSLTPLVKDGILTVDGNGRMAFAVPALAAALRALPTPYDVSSLHAKITRSLTDRLGAETAGSCYPRLAEHVAAAGAELDDALAVDVLLAAARTDARADWPRSVRAYTSALRRLTPYDHRTPGVLRECAELSLRHADHAAALALGEPLLAHLAASPAEQDRDCLDFVAEVWALAALHEHQVPYIQVCDVRVIAQFAELAGPFGIGPVPSRAEGETHRPSTAHHRTVSGPLPSSPELRLLAAAAGSRAELSAAQHTRPADANSTPDLDRLRTAVVHADLAGALTAVLGDRYAGPGNSTAAWYHAMVRDYLEGDWDQALVSARRLEAGSRTHGTTAGAAQPARALAAEIHCVRGELGRAWTWLDLIPDTVPHPLVAWARLGLRYWSGRVDEALEGALRDVRRAHGSGLFAGTEKVLLRYVSFSLVADMPQAMREGLAELEALHEVVGSPTTREAMLLGRGLVHGDTDSALAALRSVRRRGDAYLGLLCCLGLMEIGDESEQWLTEASRIAKSLGIGRATRTTLGHMTRRMTFGLPRTRPARDEFGEEDVRLTTMVSEGATNRQIAARLAWSEKTVERRLTQLFHRTGCRSRVELAAAWLDGSLARRLLVPEGAPRTGGGSVRGTPSARP
ncbi:helix-turn-helix transcriptional regulator [Streptomyces xylophagus]|uniref:helix-turn-helix transcriptional regulator n=1 Tax=Streptomyces xylophagus TaxID=285514 RepID=UPI00068FC985|nr:LuxR family transcriptional regulator [Streptomyces xylophagus]